MFYQFGPVNKGDGWRAEKVAGTISGEGRGATGRQLFRNSNIAEIALRRITCRGWVRRRNV